jgi:hypothetical protein
MSLSPRLLKLRQYVLLFAETFDALRVIPRIMVMAYGYLVISLYIWYRSIPTYVQEKCDSAIVTDLMNRGKSLTEIKQLACSVADVVGGPTAAQSTFVTTIIGLSTGIFGLYATTGRKWDGWEPTDVKTTTTENDYGPSDDGRGRRREKVAVQIYGKGDSDQPSP